MWRYGTPPQLAAVVIWLTFYVLGINFGLTYLILGMPFFLIAGRIRAVAALQAGVLVPTLLLYINEGRSLPLEAIYTPIMLVVWAALLVWWANELRAVVAQGKSRLISRSAVA